VAQRGEDTEEVEWLLKKKDAEELREKLPGEKLRTWFYTCANTCGGDVEVFHANWLGAARHYRESLTLTDESTGILF
jgi:hypothetical protein